MFRLLNVICIVTLLLIGCSTENENHSLDLTEEEKMLVDISYEKSVYNEIFNTMNNLSPIEITNENEEIYEKKPFEMFIPINSRIGEIVKTASDGIEAITIDYFTNDQRYIVVFFENGKVRKSTRTEYILTNFNNEEYSKYELE